MRQVQNGVGLYTTWTTIATLINLSIVLTHHALLSPLDAGTVAYGLLGALLLGWSVGTRAAPRKELHLMDQR